jgi:hypothetical protein
MEAAKTVEKLLKIWSVYPIENFESIKVMCLKII